MDEQYKNERVSKEPESEGQQEGRNFHNYQGLEELMSGGFAPPPINHDRVYFPRLNFPLEVFRGKLRGTLGYTAIQFMVQIQFIAFIVLTILSGAIGNSIRIQVVKGWLEAVFLWLVLVASSGYGKTHPVSFFMKQVKRRAFDPKFINSYISDYTSESLRKVFQNNPRGTILDRDEIAGFFQGLGKYSGGGGDRELLLELFSCNPIKVNRAGDLPQFIPNTGMAIIGGIQPKKLFSVFDEKSFEDGLASRFIFLLGTRQKKKLNKEGIREDVLAYYEGLYDFCLSLPCEIGEDGFVKHNIIPLSDEALASFNEYFDRMEEIAMSEYLSDEMRVFIPKYHSYCVKLAGILHVIDSFETKQPVSRQIEKTTMDNAIKLIEFIAGETVDAIDYWKLVAISNMAPDEKRMIKTLYLLRNQVSSGKISLALIREEFNKGLATNFQIEKNKTKRLGTILRKFNLNTSQGVGGTWDLIWDESVITPLFSKYSIYLRSVCSKGGE